MTNREWISKGRTGCTFATLFAKHPEVVGWQFMDSIQWKANERDPLFKALIVGIEFPDHFSREMVREWALDNGFYEEGTGTETVGLRMNCQKV